MNAAAEEEWVQAAMTDDNLVVELLIGLHSARPSPNPPPPREAVLPLEWTVRQRRSKSISVNHHHKPRKPPHRGSPTTPLSWSGGASLSGGCAGEESVRQPPFKPENAARSKDSTNNKKTAAKRSRKKKTLAELKGEECSLWKEKRELKREIAALRLNLERHRATNENLKRIKVELQPQLERRSMSVVEESTPNPRHVIPPTELPTISNDVIELESTTSSAHQELPTDMPSDPKFILPDLNMPFDEPSSNITCGVS